MLRVPIIDSLDPVMVLLQMLRSLAQSRQMFNLSRVRPKTVHHRDSVLSVRVKCPHTYVYLSGDRRQTWHENYRLARVPIGALACSEREIRVSAISSMIP